MSVFQGGTGRTPKGPSVTVTLLIQSNKSSVTVSVTIQLINSENMLSVCNY